MAEYIEREALIRYVEKQEVIIKDGLSIAEAMRIQGNVFRRAVETCPAADVAEVRHGKWNFRKNWDFFVCSECSFEHTNYSHYCPNCGARMKGKGGTV